MRAAPRDPVRVLLVLGRVSNLPTVWSNCLAAWFIAGGTNWDRFLLICVSATFFYLGGMFLNDAFDVSFDSRYRPERPIPSGQIQRQTVWLLGFVWLSVGCITAAFAGMLSCVAGAVLSLAIIIYDWRHKRFSGAPWVMASCRFLVYMLMASAVAGTASIKRCALPGLDVFAYILGLSFLARMESGPGEGKAVRNCLRVWPMGLLFLPVVTALVLHRNSRGIFWIAAGIQVGWLFWCIARRLSRDAFFRAGVAGLLAGIPLVDWLNAGPVSGSTAGAFLGLFLLALALQRWAPAT